MATDDPSTLDQGEGSLSPSTESDRLPRAHVGPYRLQALLGRGGMGSVYAAVDERLGRRVAVKQVPSHLVDQTRRRRFRREAEALARLSHPAIVQIFDWLETPDGDWIVMELVNGSTLADLLVDGPLSISRAIEIARQVADGLDEAHGRGLVHRDLKAENVMVRRPGGGRDQVKILDFGLAKAMESDGESELSRSGQLLGTYRAMSPEQARGLPLDARSDLFSLGILLYEMLTGRSPFSGETVIETLNRLVGHPHRPALGIRSDVPGALSELVDRLLEKSPGARPASARQVAEELDRLASTRSTEPKASGSSGFVMDASTVDGSILGGSNEHGSPLEAAAVEAAAVEAAAVEAAAVEAARAEGPSAAGRPFRSRFLVWSAAGFGAVALMAALSAILPGSSSEEPPTSIVAESPVAEVALEGPDPHDFFRKGMRVLEAADRPEDLDRAISAFEQALELDERSAAATAGLSMAYHLKYFQSRDPLHLRQAVSVAEQAVRLEEHLALARVALGLAKAFEGHPEEAEAHLAVALQLDPANAWAYGALGWFHRQQDRFEESIAAFERAVRLAPRDRLLKQELGTLYYRAARYEDAEAQFRAGVELAPKRTDGYRDLSAALFMLGRLPEAAEVLQQALAIGPEHDLYSNLGTILFAQGLYSPAAGAFDKALQQGGANFYYYWANLADSQRQMADGQDASRESYGQAIRLLRREMERNPRSAFLRSRLAMYLAKRGDREAALRELAGLRLQSELQAEELYRMAVAYEVCDLRSEALEMLGRALDQGYPESQVEADPELSNLRTAPGYHRLTSS